MKHLPPILALAVILPLAAICFGATNSTLIIAGGPPAPNPIISINRPPARTNAPVVVNRHWASFFVTNMPLTTNYICEVQISSNLLNWQVIAYLPMNGSAKTGITVSNIGCDKMFFRTRSYQESVVNGLLVVR